MKIYVQYDSYITVTRESDSNDKWDRDDTSTDWTVKGISTDSRFGDGNVEISYELAPGQIGYLVYAIYSTGDSFGHDERACIEFIDLYKTYEEAQACKIALEKPYKNYDENPVEIITSSGNKYKYHRPWCGYFEHLNEVEVQSFVLQS